MDTFKIKLTAGKDGDPSIIGNITYRSLFLFHHDKKVGNLKIKIENSGIEELFFAFKTYKFCVDHKKIKLTVAGTFEKNDHHKLAITGGEIEHHHKKYRIVSGYVETKLEAEVWQQKVCLIYLPYPKP